MKSIMEQASSIMKAIEKAWISAESPKEFSVKVFEKEEKNFFGMTTKPAKIGIFFSDKSSSQHEKVQQKIRPESSCIKPIENTKASAQPSVQHNKPVHQPAPRQQPAPQKQVETKQASAPKQSEQIKSASVQQEQPRRVPAVWNETMITTTTGWVRKTLPLIGMNGIDFNVEVAGKNLKLTFDKPLIENPIVEKQLFRSVAHLIMASLRNQYKQEIKDLKVVLIRPQ